MLPLRLVMLVMLVMLPMLPMLLTAPSQAPSLEVRVREAIAASGADVAVAYRTLDGRDALLLGADTVFHAASTMKIPVMIYESTASGR